MKLYFLPPGPRRRAPRTSEVLGVTSGLRRRLLIMLIAPLVVLAVANAWLEFRSADNVATQQDQRLLALVPLLADSVIGRSDERPLLMMAPPVEEFLKERPGSAAVFNGKATTNVTFGAPGDYILNVTANDYSGEGGAGFQCCWTTGKVKVSVAP